MKLNSYLRKIEQGQPINLEHFRRCLPSSDDGVWRKIYSYVRVRDGYLLTIDDTEAHNKLYVEKPSSRVSASKLGRSHDFQTSFSHLLVLNRVNDSQIPFVVVCDVNGFRAGGKLVGKRAVLIENIENFYRYQEFLEALGHSRLVEESDVIFGSGNQICHHLNISFLSSYEDIYCAQDVELGGLTTFKSLKNALPQCKWLAPTDWEAFRDSFKLKPKNSNHLAKAIKLARELDLNTEADLMNQTRHFMEQEAFLPVLKQD
ncbi:hypothetical protein [Vibrio aestuarianus]|uniref:hypothetical protein n=1 Tax=Vibrio aestuarianus TaxID=28171 RepID=UPI0015C538C8|nr:hypothetical protein [Vibrio aestuarianus]MDE1234738.1 hypothetical protein [Vibrio aestuarianus]MDE1245621.1 hypothetical protein [Vibrio aestuarianus]MDE1316480.1 hypothetical protein [Vibrio aestuarianus]MDE1333876.1 hypothetical protein [Vibrio aestuarianus]NGZ62879.1 hypothetical protein [Vibrio aestuarianus subsp. cardii]